MGKAQKKTGKGRLDKYYKLAKYDHSSLSCVLMYAEYAPAESRVTVPVQRSS